MNTLKNRKKQKTTKKQQKQTKIIDSKIIGMGFFKERKKKGRFLKHV